jgi:ubiquinone biosynthesis protein
MSGAVREWGRAVRVAPRLLESLARRFADDGVALRFEVREIEAFGRRLERGLDRATVGLVTAALIVGSSLLVAASASNDSFAMRFFGALGVAIAFVNSLWLLAAIRRSRR